MARTESKMLALGTAAPEFKLPDTEGHFVSRKDFEGNPLLVMFICNHCPFVKHIRPALSQITSAYLKKGVAIVAINSNDAVNFPEDSPEKMATEKRDQNYQFPYLFDETQSVARLYDAACTPDFFLFDRSHKLVYRGQFDDSRPGSAATVSGSDLKAAMDEVLAGRPVSSQQKPSLGCNIKWKR